MTQEYLYQGVNKNIDAESRLFQLGEYWTQDCNEHVLCDKKQDPESEKQMFKTYFSDNRGIYPNMTPKTFHNFTKIINNYPIGVDYKKYNRYIYDAERCIALNDNLQFNTSG